MSKAVNDKLKLVKSVTEKYGNEVTEKELLSLSEDIGSEDFDYLAGVVIYLRQRLIHRKSRIDSFRVAFPERCYKTSAAIGSRFDTDKPTGAPLDASTINIKAKRIEEGKAYRAALAVINTSMYVAYAVERLDVLDKAYEIAMDEGTLNRDRFQYMKLFLEETRKPEDAQKMELNFNLTQNNVSINDLENKLADIANNLSSMGASAQQVIGVLTQKKDDTIEANIVKE